MASLLVPLMALPGSSPFGESVTSTWTEYPRLYSGFLVDRSSLVDWLFISNRWNVPSHAFPISFRLLHSIHPALFLPILKNPIIVIDSSKLEQQLFHLQIVCYIEEKRKNVRKEAHSQQDQEIVNSDLTHDWEEPMSSLFCDRCWPLKITESYDTNSSMGKFWARTIASFGASFFRTFHAAYSGYHSDCEEGHPTDDTGSYRNVWA